MAAMPIVLNFESRGLRGFIIALYLVFIKFTTISDMSSLLWHKRKIQTKIKIVRRKKKPINRDGHKSEDADADGEDRYVAAKFAKDETFKE